MRLRRIRSNNEYNMPVSLSALLCPSPSPSKMCRGRDGKRMLFLWLTGAVLVTTVRMKLLYVSSPPRAATEMIMNDSAPSLLSSSVIDEKTFLLALQEDSVPNEIRNVNETMQQQQPHHHMVFYNFYGPTESIEGLGNAFRIATEQLQMMGLAATPERPFLINIVTIGAQPFLTPEKLQDICPSVPYQPSHGPPIVQCVHLKHETDAFEEATLQPLYEYCTKQSAVTTQKKDVRVTYIHSKGSFHPSKSNDIWRRYLTLATVHKDCLSPPITASMNHIGDEDTCNVCGLQFYPFWTMLFPGNMWTADCSYVRQLVPPIHFRTKQEEMVNHAKQSSKAFGHGTPLARTLYPVKDFSLGLGRYAPEHWIGSHPSLVPCDLSNKVGVSYWGSGGTGKESKFTWALAPRKRITNRWFLLDRRRMGALLQETSAKNRLNEFFLLPGYIFKWQLLYQQVPPPTSWVWKWFPDGMEWLENVL